jgi:hypothetical protein
MWQRDIQYAKNGMLLGNSYKFVFRALNRNKIRSPRNWNFVSKGKKVKQ